MPYRSFSSSLCYLMRFSIPILTGSLEKRLPVLDPETWVGSGAALILSTHKSTRRDWKAFLKYEPHQNFLRSRLAWVLQRNSFDSDPNTVNPHPKRVSKNFVEERLSVAVFLDMSRVFGAVLVDSHLYKLIVFNFPSYIVKSVSSTCIFGRSESPSEQPLVVVYVLV